jgi:hypothetical protein
MTFLVFWGTQGYKTHRWCAPYEVQNYSIDLPPNWTKFLFNFFNSVLRSDRGRTVINLRALGFCEVLQQLKKIAEFAKLRVFYCIPTFLDVSGSFCWRSLNPHWRLCGVCPKSKRGRKDVCWSAAGACQHAQGNVSLRSSQGEATSASQGAAQP